jgi:hypothetical protein
MTTPVPARDHANMTVAEREFTFDALLDDFRELETAGGDAETPAANAAVDSRLHTRRAPDASAPQPASAEPATAKPEAASRPTPTMRRPLAWPSPQVLKLTALIAVAVLSLTLVFIALTL